jgi:hypothetical protein
MGDLSVSFDPNAIALNSDVASSALAMGSDAASKAAVAQSKASDASSAVVKITRVVILKPYAEASAIASGDGKAYFAVPVELNGMNLVSVGGHVYTAATSGAVSCQIANVTSGVDMLSTKLTFDATEKDTATAATPAAINASNDGVATGEEIRVDIDAAAAGAKGLEIRLGFQLP